MESSLNTPKYMEDIMGQGRFVPFSFFASIMTRDSIGLFGLHYVSRAPIFLVSIAAVEKVQSEGKVCVLDIDVQGVQKVKQSSLEPYYCFISPPSKEDLEKRLRGRGTETEEQIKTRLGNAAKELEYG